MKAPAVLPDLPLPDLPAIRLRVCFYREASPAWEVAAHHHDIHQWYVGLHGAFKAGIDGTLHAIGAEQSIIVPPGARRELRMGRRAPGYLVVIFEALALDLAPVAGRVLSLPAPLREDLHALVHELQHPQEDARLLVQTLVTRLLIGHKRSGTQAAGALPALNASTHREVVEAAERYLHDHLDQPIQRREIAAALHLSGPHLARVFRAATGRTLVQRLTELRLHKAKELLRESTWSVTQVASAVGMVSFSHFARTFKRAVGASPGDYRRSRGLLWE